MLTIDREHPFFATWHPALNNEQGAFGNIVRRVKNVLFYIPNSIMAAIINPRSASRVYPLSYAFSPSESISKEIICPDNVHVKAEVVLAKGATELTPTIILFNPLGTNGDIYDRLVNKFNNCNFVLFNYREWKATWRAQDLIVDGDSVYQYVVRELGINQDKVHFFGYSLGGAIALQVKALHPESLGKYVGDRVFLSVFRFISENFCIARLGRVIKIITSSISSILLAWPIYLLGWEWDGSRAMRQIRGDKLIICHPNDFLVPREASLACQASEEEVLYLSRNEIGPRTHFAPINEHVTEQDERADQIVANFLCSSDV